MARDGWNIHGMKEYPLERIAIDPLTSLESGLGTTLFSKLQGDVIYGRWPDIYVPWPAMPSPGAVWAEVKGQIMDDLLAYGADYLAKGLAKISLPTLGEVLGEGANQMGDFLLSGEDIMKRVAGGGASDLVSGALQEGLGEGVTMLTGKLSAWIGDLKGKWETLKVKEEAWCDGLAPYICQGPTYVAQVAEQIDNHGKRVIQHEVDKYVERASTHKKAIVGMLAGSHAVKLASKANETAMDVSRKAFAKVDELKQKAQSEAKMVVKEAVLELAATIGF